MARRAKKKKGSHHGGHHGGSWKVAYADFVTAMMALFLVLWLVAQGDQKLKTAIANYFREPGAFDTAPGNIFSASGDTTNQSDGQPATVVGTLDDVKALNNAAELLRKKFSGMSNRVHVDMSDEGLHIQILDRADRASFASGSAELEPATRAILADIAASICALPNPIQIGGHTDAYTFPGEGYSNWELSADRANAARRELESVCVQAERIRRIVGYADTWPLIPDDPYAAANRHISIMLFFQKVVAKDASPAGDNPEAAKDEAKPAAVKPEKEAASTDEPEENTPVKTRPHKETPVKARHATPSEALSAKPSKPGLPVKERSVDLRTQERARRVQTDAPAKEMSLKSAAGQTRE